MTLTSEEMSKALVNAPRRKVGKASWACVNCGKMLHSEIYEDAWEIDEYGNITYDLPHAAKECECGANNLLAWQPDGQAMVYWITRSKMEASTE